VSGLRAPHYAPASIALLTDGKCRFPPHPAAHTAGTNASSFTCRELQVANSQSPESFPVPRIRSDAAIDQTPLVLPTDPHLPAFAAIASGRTIWKNATPSCPSKIGDGEKKQQLARTMALPKTDVARQFSYSTKTLTATAPELESINDFYPRAGSKSLAFAAPARFPARFPARDSLHPDKRPNASEAARRREILPNMACKQMWKARYATLLVNPQANAKPGRRGWSHRPRRGDRQQEHAGLAVDGIASAGGRAYPLQERS